MTDQLPLFGHVINRQECASSDGTIVESVDPWTREPWATVALGGPIEAELAIETSAASSSLSPRQ